MSAYLGNQKFQLKSALGGQAGGPAKWGEITGNIGDQADLASKLVEVSASSTLSAKDYTDDKVKDGRLTIIQGDVQKGSFSANQGSNLSIILDPPSSQGEWGNIFGNIEDQRDLTQRIDAAASGALTDAQEYTDSQIAQLDIPTRVSQLQNDAGYCTASDAMGYAAEAKQEANSYTDAAVQSVEDEIPTKVSELQNDAGYLSAHQSLSAYALSADVTSQINRIDGVLILKADKEEIPSKVSELENDAGYLSAHQSLTAYALKTEIPTVNDASITIKQGDDIKGTFTLNQSNNLTVELSAGGGSSGSESDPVFTAWKDGQTILAGSSAAGSNGGAVAIGYQAKGNSYHGVAIGKGSHAYGGSSVGGYSLYTVAVGDSAEAGVAGGGMLSDGSLAVGYKSKSSGGASTAVGPSATATGSSSTAVGVSSKASGTGSLALGNSATATANNSIAIGQSASATAQWCIQLGGGSNNVSGSFKVDDWPLLNLQTGKIYADRIEGGSGGGAVTKIIAGSNITISPASGTGEVTINASGGSGGSYVAGYGIDIQDNTISVDTSVIATKDDIGAINSVLDAINGEVI